MVGRIFWGKSQKVRLSSGCSQTMLADFWTFLTPSPPWLTALGNKICDFYLETLTFGEPPSPLAVNIICE